MSATDRMSCAEALDLAKRWAGKGLHAFPIAIAWDPKKQSTNKRPLTADGGFYNATTDPAELERLFNAMSPRPGEVWGVGLWPGPSGYVVLDPDIKNGQHGDDELAALEAEHGPLDTLRAVTASGGGHVYLKKPVGVHIGNADLADGLEVRSDAGYVVAIGTRTPWGSWDHDAATPRAAIDCPRWLLDRLASTNGHGGGPKGRWSPLDRSKLHPADLTALEALEALGGHDAFVGGDGSVLITRPGKTAGASASIGHIGPGIVKVFTPNWPPLKQDAVYDADQLADMLPIGDTTDRPKWASLIIDVKTWLTSCPDHPEPLWGNERTMLAAKGQATTIAGPQGAGKSAIGQRIFLGHLGLVDQVLGLPVARGQRSGLYLACDRPEQARLSMRRMVADDQLDELANRGRVWKGPPPEDVAKQPLMLLRMAEEADADLVVIDSAKDVALKLSADEVGAAYNSALQHCVAAGIEVLALHHPRKLSGDMRDNPVRVLDDLYGAYWVTAGNGSVIYLQPGEFETYTLTQLKSPIGEKAEIPYEHVIATGDVRPPTAPGLEAILEKAGQEGITTTHAARCLYKVDKPTESQLRAVRRALQVLAEDGTAEPVGGSTKGKRWRLSG